MAMAMRVEDVYVQGRRSWIRLHEKGGKRHEMPCHHLLEQYLNEYRDAAEESFDPKACSSDRLCGTRGGSGSEQSLSQMLTG